MPDRQVGSDDGIRAHENARAAVAELLMRFVVVMPVLFVRPFIFTMPMARARVGRLHGKGLRLEHRTELVRMTQATSEQNMHGHCRKGQDVHHSVHGRLAMHGCFQGTFYNNDSLKQRFGSM